MPAVPRISENENLLHYNTMTSLLSIFCYFLIEFLFANLLKDIFTGVTDSLPKYSIDFIIRKTAAEKKKLQNKHILII